MLPCSWRLATINIDGLFNDWSHERLLRASTRAGYSLRTTRPDHFAFNSSLIVLAPGLISSVNSVLLL